MVKIKHGKWNIALNSLIRAEWRGWFPRIIIHEKFEKYIKWTLRILTVIGVLSSLVSMQIWAALCLSLGLLGLEQFLERIIFEYTIMIVQPFPEFKVDYDQWLTNGYLFPNPELEGHENLLNAFGPVYQDKEYAIKFFNYIKSWNLGQPEDPNNNICISFVIEKNGYSMYLFANPNRVWVNKQFKSIRENVKYEKYGKQQQSLVFQMTYWKTLRLYENSLFPKFIASQPTNAAFNFMPFYLDNEKVVPIEELAVKKFHYRCTERSKLSKRNSEYHLPPDDLD